MIKKNSNQTQVSMRYGDKSFSASGQKADLIVYGVSFLSLCAGIYLIAKTYTDYQRNNSNFQIPN